MFRDQRAISGFSTNDIDAARAFYADTLGVSVTEENGMLNLHLGGGGEVIVYPKPNHEPATYTVLNFLVPDIDAAVDALTGKGVTMARYEGLEQDAKGVMRDQGPPIAWFTDPAGNILAVIQS